jgi:hypothetical protein
MPAVDLALYADELAARAASLAARMERARAALRRAAVEHEARGALPADDVVVLERLGVLGTGDHDVRAGEELAEATRALAAVQRLQAWVEARLDEGRGAAGNAAAGREERQPMVVG